MEQAARRTISKQGDVMVQIDTTRWSYLVLGEHPEKAPPLPFTSKRRSFAGIVGDAAKDLYRRRGKLLVLPLTLRLYKDTLLAPEHVGDYEISFCFAVDVKPIFRR
jgi:hypothetical protein